MVGLLSECHNGGIGRCQFLKTRTSSLNIPDNAYPVFGMCMGYPDRTPDLNPRLPLGLILKEETFDAPFPGKSRQTFWVTMTRPSATIT